MRDNRNINQENYSLYSEEYSKIKLDSTMYLAYRDLPKLIKKHLSSTSIKVLDYGCGPGISTEILFSIFKQLNIRVNIVGVDINEENIKLARKRLDKFNNIVFIPIKKSELLETLTDFDLVLCNFVLLENTQPDIIRILENINFALRDRGKLIVTNTTAKTYYQNNNWYSLDNKFEENKPKLNENGKLKLQNGQPVKLRLHDYTTKSSFIVSDFFYSGRFYRNAYMQTGFSLLDVAKPIAHESDDMYQKLKSEKTTPPYKIHILEKTNELSLIKIQKMALASKL